MAAAGRAAWQVTQKQSSLLLPRVGGSGKLKVKRLRQDVFVDKVRALIANRPFVAVAHTGNLNLAASMEVRAALGAAGASFSPIKNAQSIRALEAEGFGELVPLMKGYVAICAGDADVSMAKAMVGLSKTVPEFFPLGGMLQRRLVIEATDIVKLAKLPPREQVLGEMIGAMSPGSFFQLPQPAVPLIGVLSTHVKQQGAASPECS